MDISATERWFLELNGEERSFASSQEVAVAVVDCQALEDGRLSISYDDGPRPKWQRLLGSAPRYISGFAALEWSREFASLIFHDENWSEYRALDTASPVGAPEHIRAQIAHGEPTPHPEDECMDRGRAFQAIQEALQTGDRPGWLSYRFVE